MLGIPDCAGRRAKLLLSHAKPRWGSGSSAGGIRGAEQPGELRGGDGGFAERLEASWRGQEPPRGLGRRRQRSGMVGVGEWGGNPSARVFAPLTLRPRPATGVRPPGVGVAVAAVDRGEKKLTKRRLYF